jgi:hypothetical protein
MKYPDLDNDWLDSEANLDSHKEGAMKEIADVLNTAKAPRTERLKAQRAFLKKRSEIWRKIQDRRFPESYLSIGKRKFVGAPMRTAIRCDFLLASKIALGRKYMKDEISDRAQRDLLFSVLREREVFPNRTGNKFYCCPKCTGRLYECVSSKVFRYIDNAKWKSAIESH